MPLELIPNSAADRPLRLAAEQTLLAWIRTGLAMMGFGFVVAKFGLFLRKMMVAAGKEMPHAYRASLWLGVALVLLGVGTTLLAAIGHYRFLRRLDRGQDPFEMRRWLALSVAVMLGLIGSLMAWYLVFVGR